MSVAGSWDAAADDWIRWAREPGHDRTFWEVNLPGLLGLVPPPGRRTVDLGCGEGRLARELAARGHSVVGVEPSPRLAAAARAAGTSVVEARAEHLPLEDTSADLVVACMTLLDIEDLPAAMAEVARILEPGGRFVFATAHPMSTGAKVGDYLATTELRATVERDGLRMCFHDLHRPLSALVGAITGAGLLLEALREPDTEMLHGRAVRAT